LGRRSRGDSLIGEGYWFRDQTPPLLPPWRQPLRGPTVRPSAYSRPSAPLRLCAISVLVRFDSVTSDPEHGRTRAVTQWRRETEMENHGSTRMDTDCDCPELVDRGATAP
jgi:hypothetical protein